MCGIFSYIGKKNTAAETVIDGLKHLEYRGYDSWGIAYISGAQLKTHKAVGKIVHVPDFPETTMAIGHNRWATHGGVTVENAHPHVDCTDTIAVVHNGIIENYQELRNQLQAKGHKFKSQTDTEVFVHLVEEYSPAGFEEAVKKAFSEVHGRNGFVVEHKLEKKLIGIRNGSPMIIGVGDNEFFIASDASAFLPYTQKVIFLEDNQGAVITEKECSCFDVAKNTTFKPHIQTINWTVDQAQKGEYDHFMLKEIMEQPKTVYAASSQNKKDIIEFANAIKKAYGSYIVACGTASYAALYGTYAFARIANRHINHSVGSEFENCQKFITDESLIIAVSQSGETADTLMAIDEAKSKNAKTAAIVNVMGSTLMRTVDISFLSHAGPEIAVVSTKAFISQLSVLLLLAYATNGKYEEGKELLKKTAKELEKMLNPTVLQNIKQIALKLKNRQHVYCIGKGQNYPIALESALKIKEASYIHAEGFAAGELKHGVIALIEKDTPCIVVFANDEDKAYMIGSAMEVKSRGGHIIGIGPEYNEIFDEFIQTPDIPETSPIINTPVIQLIAYYLAVARGNNPDRPRNLAKSVTVK